MTDKNDTENQNNADILSQNYHQMDETGKEKLKEVSDHILEMWKIIHGEKHKNRA